MVWWKKLFGGASEKSLDTAMYRVDSTLYSLDGNRSAEIREFDNGQTFLLESERVSGTEFKQRHDGRMVGPFRSPEQAEQFIIGTAWFRGN